MKTRSILTLGTAISFFILTPGLALHAGSSAAEALHQLDQAKTSKNPFIHLEKAKGQLEGTASVKQSRRLEAIDEMDKAIDAIHTIEHEAMEKHIERAIHNIKEGLR